MLCESLCAVEGSSSRVFRQIAGDGKVRRLIPSLFSLTVDYQTLIINLRAPLWGELLSDEIQLKSLSGECKVDWRSQSSEVYASWEVHCYSWHTKKDIPVKSLSLKHFFSCLCRRLWPESRRKIGSKLVSELGGWRKKIGQIFGIV